MWRGLLSDTTQFQPSYVRQLADYLPLEAGTA